VTARLDPNGFAVLARRRCATISDAEIAILYEGYGLLERLVAELDRPDDPATEPATVFVPQAGP
jgi:hypothetical protein